MKKQSTRLLIILSCSTSITSFSYSQHGSQPPDIQIDPRQYVTVHYRKYPTQERMDTIWNWEWRKNIPNQKFRYLDMDGEIKIDFSKHSLITNRDFEGTISLEAEISGPNGSRNIEVNPYSEIGVQRIPIGIKSEPPSEISKKLLNMLIELQDVGSIYNGIEEARFYYDNMSAKEDFYQKLDECEKAAARPGARLAVLLRDSIVLKNDIRSMSFTYLEYDHPNLFSNISRISQYQQILRKVREDIKRYDQVCRKRFIETFRNALVFVNSKTGIVLEYLNSFEAAGEDATKAFLSLVNKDLIGYRILKEGLINRQNMLSEIDISGIQQDAVLDSVLSKNADLIIDCSKNLANLAKFKGSQLESIIKSYAVMHGRRIEDETFPDWYNKEDKERKFNSMILDRYFEQISDTLSVNAGRMIYKKLIYATIDLGKSGARKGEVLNIYVTWILDSKRDSSVNSPRLPIGKYYLTETGWKIDIRDMFSLVKRRHEPDPEKEGTNVSPTNFKGAGGAVLMWAFNKQDRGLKYKNVDGDLKVKRKNALINFLEPSFGLNVSYLDFDTDKDVEIGTGLQVGIFRNKIFFGYGVNINLLSPKHQSPSYFYAGFSFASLSEFFKNSNEVRSMQ